MLMLLALFSCASECDDLARINGTYEVLSTVNSHTPEDVGEMPTTTVFFNGIWDWDLQYLRDSGNVRMTIDGQETTARLVNDGACNAMSLSISSWNFVGDATQLGDDEPVDATHSVVWAADLVWQGDQLSGAYTVDDSWKTSDGLNGSMSAEGSISGTLVESKE